MLIWAGTRALFGIGGAVARLIARIGGMLATDTRGALQRLAARRAMRAERNARGAPGHTLGHDMPAQRQPLPQTV